MIFKIFFLQFSLESEESEDSPIQMPSKETTAYYFKKALVKAPRSSTLSYVILPDSWLSTTIGVITIIATCTSCILTTYFFAFQDFSLGTLILAYLVDAIILIRVYLEFHFSFYDKYGNYVIKMEKIRKRYMKDKFRLSLDVVSNIPLDFLALFVEESWKYKVLSVLRMNRMLRLHYIFDFHKSKVNSLMVNKIYLELRLVIKRKMGPLLCRSQNERRMATLL